MMNLIKKKNLVSTIQKEFLLLNNKRKNKNVTKQWAKDQNRYFSKNIHKWPINMHKDEPLTFREMHYQNHKNRVHINENPVVKK